MSFSIWDYVNPLDLEELARRYRAATPTHMLTMDSFLREDFAREVSESYPDYQSAQRRGREFKWVNERVKVQITDTTLMPEPVVTLNKVINSDELRQVFAEITGIGPLVSDPGLAGAGMHIMGRGGSLGVHTDFTQIESGVHRRLNILVYLNPVWQDEWDGAFEMWDPDVKHRVERIVPEFNRCAIFNTTTESFHAVSAIQCPSEMNRLSFASYYYTEDPPEGWDGVFRNTIYKARPNERYKRYVQMPFENFRKPIEKRIRRTYYQLRGWDWEEKLPEAKVEQSESES